MTIAYTGSAAFLVLAQGHQSVHLVCKFAQTCSFYSMVT